MTAAKLVSIREATRDSRVKANYLNGIQSVHIPIWMIVIKMLSAWTTAAAVSAFESHIPIAIISRV